MPYPKITSLTPFEKYYKVFTYISCLNLKECYILGWKMIIVYQNMIFFIHLKFRFFLQQFSDQNVKFINILSWQSNSITFSKRSKGLLPYMFFSRCVNWDILGIETFCGTMSLSVHQKICTNPTFRTSRRRSTWGIHFSPRPQYTVT